MKKWLLKKSYVGVIVIDGVVITKLKRIEHEKGDILHALKCSDEGFSGFGEAYFSSIHGGHVKGWKKHTKMLMNLIVPFGTVKFVLHDDRRDSPTSGAFSAHILGEKNYCRLTVPEGVWVAFQGVSEKENWLLNIASIEHDPNEAINAPLENINYDWNEDE